MGRLFTFGCSFTGVSIWPSWANIIAYDLGMNLHNYGQPGFGNFGIAQRVFQVNTTENVTKKDLQLILWSSWDREDRLKNGQWQGEGSVFTNDEIYGNKWIKKYYDDSDKIMKNIYYIVSTNQMFGDKIAWQGSGFGYYVNDTWSDGIPKGVDEHAEKCIKKYGHLLPKLYTWLDAEKEKAFDGLLEDKHPDIKKQLELVKNVIYPSIGKTIKDSTVEFFETMHDELVVELKKYKLTSDNEYEIVHKTLSKKYPVFYRDFMIAKHNNLVA